MNLKTASSCIIILISKRQNRIKAEWALKSYDKTMKHILMKQDRPQPTPNAPKTELKEAKPIRLDCHCAQVKYQVLHLTDSQYVID